MIHKEYVDVLVIKQDFNSCRGAIWLLGKDTSGKKIKQLHNTQ